MQDSTEQHHSPEVSWNIGVDSLGPGQSMPPIATTF